MAKRPISIFDERTVVNPGTIIRLSYADKATPDWVEDVGRLFMVGFYRPSSGLDCVWLVTPQGMYEQTADTQSLLKYFTVVKPSYISDYYGKHYENLPKWPRSLLAKPLRSKELVHASS